MEFNDRFQKTARGDMDWQLTATFPGLDYVPMYCYLKPKLTYSLAIEPAPKQESSNEDVAVANYFRN
jgi:hypothetical protein